MIIKAGSLTEPHNLWKWSCHHMFAESLSMALKDRDQNSKSKLRGLASSKMTKSNQDIARKTKKKLMSSLYTRK
jgi:hypothetical protein